MVTFGRRPAVAWGGVAALLAVAILAPDPVPLAAARLAALAIAVTGAALLVGRAAAADLATAAAVGGGAYLGGVASALLGLPVLVGLPAGIVAGAAIGAVSGALHGRVGRILGALTSLAIGTAFVAVAGGTPLGGGVAGFHAVGLPAPGGPRVEAAAVALVLLVALAVAAVVGRRRWAAGARLAVEAPVVAASVGRHPAGDAAAVGAVAGGLLGAGGTLLAAVDGSVLPGAYGLELAAALALAAVLGGAPPVGPVLGTLLVWGPGSVWPLVPLVGTAPPLLVMGPVGLVLLAARRGRPVVAWSRDRVPGTDAARAPGAQRPRQPRQPGALTLMVPATAIGGAPAAGGTSATQEVTVHPGEVVALVGPNGAGKSTVLARIGGQLADHGDVRLGGSPAPHGVRARANVGVARSWQRPPAVPAEDLLAVTLTDPDAVAAARWAAATLADDHLPTAATLADDHLPTAATLADDHPPTAATADGPPSRDSRLAALPAGVLQLLVVAARGPAVALLDEPTDVPPDALARYVAGLAGAGTAVLVVDHRPEVVAVADRVVTIAAGPAAPGRGAGRTSAEFDDDPRDVPAAPRQPAGSPEVGASRVRLHLDDPALDLDVAPGEVVELPDDDRVVAALLARGDVALDGRSLRRRGPAGRVRAGLGAVVGVEVAPDVTVAEHLGAVVPLAEARRLLAAVPGLAARADDPAGVLSGGERRLLAWLVASARQPRAVVLDRAGTGLDADALRWASEQVERWRADGVAVLVRPGREEERGWLTRPVEPR
jgi:ABC-type branched-subunit amino acid transport system ATPase component/ABC-type branched-subunit amino acid transport system permease subunit